MAVTVLQRRSTATPLVFTLDQALYAAVFAVALLLRIWHLGSIPLDTVESGAALRSWSIYAGGSAAAQGSPLLTYLNALIFFVFGASDASARAVPSLVGAAMVVLPYFGRQYIGRYAALMAAVLLAFSPTMVYFSRYVGAATLVAALSLGLVFGFIHYVRARTIGEIAARREGPKHGADFYLWLTAVLLGLLLSSGGIAYLNVLVLATFPLGLALLRQFSSVLPGVGDLPSFADMWPGANRARTWAVIFVATLGVGATGGLANLHGIQEATADAISQWWRTEAISSSYVQLLLVYETLIVVFAAVNVFYSTARKRVYYWFMVWWAGASLVLLTFAPEKSAAFVVQPLVPITLLAADLIGRLLAWFVDTRPSVGLGVLALVSLPPLLLLGFVLSRFSLPAESSIPLAFAAIPISVIVLAIVGSVYWRGTAYATHLWGVLWLGILFVVTVHAMANLSLQPDANPSELLRGKVITPDIRNLVFDVDRVRDSAVDQGRKGDVVVADPSQRDVLGWYLRQHNPKFSDSKFPSTDGRPLVILGRPDVQLPPGEWAMQRYSIGVSSRPNLADFRQVWRWLIYREAPLPATYDSVVMYVSL
ncbi:MAG: glycosyltransferase family 39 protein [Chloroflexi bacterium]|nr:glycosyltransferase family 39 protein [Chloroflexota bacterium]